MLRTEIDEIMKQGLPYIINTLFDAVFTILGIVVGSAFGSVIDTRAIIGTMVTASISLGVSSGFSIYEGESLQEDKRIDEIEEALLSDLEDTVIEEKSRHTTLFSAILVFFTPLIVCLFTLIPFAMVYLGVISVQKSLLYAVGTDLALIFLSGYVFGGEKRLRKGIRMTVLGGLIFLVGFLLNRMV